MSGTEIRPERFTMKIQGGMLEALGINMYSTLGKCLVEFLANAYDAEACRVDVTIPFAEIEKAREKVRAAAKEEVELGVREKTTLLTLPLPDGLEVVIRDNGHGMTPRDVESKFLPFNRNRRWDPEMMREAIELSEGGKRRVMGRKGLGKLAGFGAAEIVTVKTKRKGLPYATEITLAYDELKKVDSLTDTPITPVYHDGIPPEEHWTEIRLARLKCDAVKYGEQTLENTLADNFFGIEPADFSIRLNDNEVKQPVVEYEFHYPETREPDGLAPAAITVDGFGEIPFRYAVKFRRRGDNLPASKRGARIYCNNRLAGGPSLFSLPTGMHGFHNISYMECIAKADEFDRLGIDLINTNRTQLKEDNEAVNMLIEHVCELMKTAVAKHAKFRDEKAEKEVKESPTGGFLHRIIERMPAKTRRAASAVINRIASDYGVESPEFSEMAPMVIESMNASEVLIRLLEMGADVRSIPQVAGALRELAEIEKSDALKLYRGRRDGIKALISLINKGDELWGKKGIEKELHALLKKAPWLIRPDFGRYTASDTNLENTYSRIARDLKIDAFAEEESADKDESAKRRPDLVFVAGAATDASEVVVVELKSPSIPLESEHLEQLKFYMNRIGDWFAEEYGRRIPVKGYLIGARAPSASMAQGVYMLRKTEEERGPDARWTVRGLEELAEHAMRFHVDEIKSLEEELPEENALKAAAKK